MRNSKFSNCRNWECCVGMWRHIILIAAFCSIFIHVSAQQKALKEKEFKVLTHLENSVTREQIDGKVLIMKKDSTLLWEMHIDKWGDTYLIAKGEPGDTVIYKFMADGYHPVTMNFVIPLKGKEPMKRIKPVSLLKESVRTLDEVTVRRSKVKMVMRGDTIVYNADAFELSNGSMLDALIARLPGAELKDGIIKVNGEYVNELLLNGESFFKGDAGVALQNLPAFTIKNLKVYRKDHESAYMTGETKDKKTLPLVMDVILKREYSTGWMGNMEAGYGLPGNRWMGRAFLLGFADNLRLTAFGNANNINNTTTAGTGGQWKQGNIMSGENRTIKEGIDYLFHNRKTPFKFSGDVTLMHNHNHTLTESSGRNFIPEGDIWIRKRNDARSKDFSLSTTHTMEFRGTSIFGNNRMNLLYADNRNRSLSREAVFNSEPSEKCRVSALDSVFAGIESPGLLRKLSYRYADEYQTVLRNFSGTLMHSGVVQVPGSMDNLNYAIQGSYRRSHQESPHLYETFYPHDPDRSEQSRRNQERITPAWDVMGILTYSQMNAFKRNNTSMNILYYITYNLKSDTEDNSWYDVMDQTSMRNSFMATLDPENSFHQRIRSNSPVGRVELQLSSVRFSSATLSRKHLFLYSSLALVDKVGIERLEYNSPVYHSELSRTSNFFQPSVSLSLTHSHSFRNDTTEQWQTGASNSFSLKYEYRDRTAPLSYGLDYRRSPNPMNVYLPNHNLGRAVNHNLEFQWQHKGRNQRMMNIYAYMNINPKAFVQARFYDRETGVSTWMPDIISGNWNSYIHYGLEKPVTRNRGLQLKSTTYFYHDNNVDYVSVTESPERTTVVTNTPGESLSLTWQHARVVLSGAFSAELKTVRSRRPDFENLNLFYIKPSFNVTLPLPGGIQFSTNLDAVKHYGYSDPNLRRAEILWNAEVSRGIFDGRLLLKLRAYDILGKVNPNKTIVNAQGVTETFTNTLTRYVMLQLTYNFTRQPKKKDAVLPEEKYFTVH